MPAPRQAQAQARHDREHVDTLARDIHDACDTLEKKGGAHESERARMVVPERVKHGADSHVFC